ncbi:MAG TPA: glycosyltransferase family 39 protein [Candidatus Deferrimicrobium sp.]|nr:glycosyltransferase family 39 protein [Candidatus Deferrimicrobium sp.]
MNVNATNSNRIGSRRISSSILDVASETWRAHKGALFIALIAFLVRLIYLIELSRQRGFTVPMIDEQWHWEWAHEILQKSFWGEGAYFRGPLYPYFLALLAKITGSSIFWTKLLQLFVCSATAFFLFRLADTLFDRKTAWVSGLIYALYGTLIFYDTMFLIEVLFLLFLAWGMYRLVAFKESSAFKTWLFTGVIFGLAAITRPNVLIVVPFLILWLFFTRPQGMSFLGRLKAPLVIMVGAALAILPVTVRNLAVTGEFILISSQGGVNLYLGNNPYADGLSMLMPEVELNESLSWRQFIPLTRAAAERATGRSMSEGELSSFWTGKAIDFMVHDPGQFAGLLWRKAVYLVDGYENSDNIDIYYQRTKSGLYAALLWDGILFFPFGVLLPLSLVGMYLHRRQLARLLPLYIFLLAYLPSILLFLVTARHRLPLVLFLIVFAATALVTFFGSLKRLGGKTIGTALILFFVSLLLVNRTYYAEGSSNTFQIHFNNGMVCDRLEDFAGAEREYLEADRSFPYSAALINNLAYAQFRLGKLAEADRNFDRAIALKPQDSRAYNNLGLLVQQQGNLDSALALFQLATGKIDSSSLQPNEAGQMYLNLAGLHDQLGRTDSADAAYQRALWAAPSMAQAYFLAAAFYARNEQYQYTDSLYTAGMRMHDPGAGDCFNWGLSFMERRRYNEGINLMYRALKLDPKLPQAYYLIAVGRLQTGAPKDTVAAYLDRCLQYDSGYRPALELRARLR